MRRVGLALAAGGALLALATLLSPFPTSPYTLASEVKAAGTLDVSRVLMATGDGEIHSYDATNDTTFLFVAYCSHSVCGPIVAVKGDLRGAGGLPRGGLLDPVDDQLSLIPAPPADEMIPRDALGIRDASEAYSSRFVVRSPWPIFLPRLIAVGLVGAGFALLARPRPWSALPGGLGAFAGLAVARAPMAIIFSQLLVIPLVIAAAVTAVVAAARKRAGWGAAAVLWFAVVMLGASFLAFFHFPPAGSAGD